MESQLTPEAYRELFDSGTCDEDDVCQHQVEAVGSRRRQAQTELFSFVDWNVVSATTTGRLLGKYTRQSTAALTCKKRLHKSTLQLPQVLPPHSAPSFSPLTQHSRPDRLKLPFDPYVTATEPDDDEGTCLPQIPSPRRDQAASPAKIRMTPAVTVPFAHLPPLDMRVLQRKRVFLSPAGAAKIGVEEIVQLHEHSSPRKPRPSPLQLTVMPKKCTSSDEVALMPCHSLQYRYVPSLSVECWREPVRDRDKNWSRDELAVVLTLHPASEKAAYAMTDPLRRHKRKWRRWEAMKLHIHSIALSGAATPLREQGLPQQVLIRNQGVMISSMYCIVSVVGVGVYGRLYSVGLAERHGASRYLRVEAYDPLTSRTFDLLVTMSDLEWVFQSRQQLLVAGKKHAIVKELLALLFFQYLNDDDTDVRGGGFEDAKAGGSDPINRQKQPVDVRASLETPQLSDSEPLGLPMLCISPAPQLSDAARRRLEREERLRRAEAERLRALALLMTLPRRARHRLLCQAVRVSGHKVIVSLYHSPSLVRSFVILAYDPVSSRTFALTVGVTEAAALSRVFTLPHRWSPEQKLLVAQSLVPMLRFNGVRTSPSEPTNRDEATEERDCYASYRMSLTIHNDRVGAPSDWLALTPVQTPEARKNEVLRKYQSDGQRSLQLAFDAKVRQLHAESDAKVVDVNTSCRAAETRKAELHERDAELREEIENINSGKSVEGVSTVASLLGEVASSSNTTSPNELRRAFKAERQRIKDDLKQLSERVGGWTRELAAIRESEATERARALKAHARAMRALESEALINTRGLYETPAPASSERRMTSTTTNTERRRMCGQRTWLARAHIVPSRTLLTSGVCVIAGGRYRCSVFRDAPCSLHSSQDDDSSDDAHVGSSPMKMLHLQLYDPVSSRSWSLQFAQLDWIAYTKRHHDAQLLVLEFAIDTSPVVERTQQLETALTANRETLILSYATKPTAATTTKKKTASKKSRAASKTVTKQRAELRAAMQRHLLELRQLNDAAPWHRMMSALSERLSFSAPDAVAVDRCIFHASLPIVSLIGDDDTPASAVGLNHDDDDVPTYDVRVLQERHEITFHVTDPTTGDAFAVVCPDSAELAKEFAVESFVEQQMHLEAIASTLLFYEDERTQKLSIRFED